MNNAKITLKWQASPFAMSYLSKLNLNNQKPNLSLATDLYIDAVKLERFRNFSQKPHFYNDQYGKRQARVKVNFRNCSDHFVTVSNYTFRKLQHFLKLGLPLSWVVEEIIFYAKQQNLCLSE